MSAKEFFVESDNDQPVVASLGAAVNKFGEFVVEMEKERYGRRSRTEKTLAVVDREDARELAKALGVGEDELSRALNGHFGEVGRNLSVADVEKLFGEVLDFILDHGVRYRLKRE